MRLYTLAEARALLPEVIPVVRDLGEAFKQLRALEASITAERRGASGDGNLLADAWADGDDRREALRARIAEAGRKLTGWEIEVKDPARGLIDFYSEREGEVVYLCYLLGEADIEYWHTLTGGFAGRQPV